VKPLQKVTMQDVANAAGVHRTTISLAFRQHPSLPVETRKRLLALAEEMGYRPNPLVSALMTELRGKRSEKQHEIIAYVTTYPADNPWRRYPSLREMFAGAQARAAKLGFAAQEFDLGAADMDGRLFRWI
jgi:LacI family transcriptional regulator